MSFNETVGGAEGATLREVLKHNTVDAVTMIEIDGELVELLKEHMPTMSDCSDFKGRAKNCFDDDRASLVLEDGKSFYKRSQLLLASTISRNTKRLGRNYI